VTRRRHLRRDRRAVAAIEFALVAPLFMMLVIGILQAGMALYASAGLRNGVEAAARLAQIYPRPSDTQISAAVASNAFGLNGAQLSTPVLTHGTANGSDYVDITASYAFRLNYLFLPGGSITLSHTRRAYQY
jgi:Flp pilus assembly protein TadG